MAAAWLIAIADMSGQVVTLLTPLTDSPTLLPVFSVAIVAAPAKWLGE